MGPLMDSVYCPQDINLTPAATRQRQHPPRFLRSLGRSRRSGWRLGRSCWLLSPSLGRDRGGFGIRQWTGMQRSRGSSDDKTFVTIARDENCLSKELCSIVCLFLQETMLTSTQSIHLPNHATYESQYCPYRVRRVRRVQFLRPPCTPRHRSYGAEVMPERTTATAILPAPSLPGPWVAHATSLTALFFAHHGLIWRSDRFIPTDIPQWFRRPRKLPSEMRVTLCSVVVSVSVDYSLLYS